MTDFRVERIKAYEVCQVRGHEPSGVVLTSNPPWSICKHCGTKYRVERRTIEMATPKEMFPEVGA